MNESFIQKAKNLKLLLTDVDGVMTDSKLCWYTDGQGNHIEVKNFESLDGMGMIFLRACGVRTGIVSRGSAPVLQYWAKMLGMDILYYSAMDKTAALLDACARFGVTPAETAFIGDDIIDLGVLNAAGFRICVDNAVDEVKALADYISSKRGGYGAVREICEQILKARGQWDDVVRQVAAGTFQDTRRELCIVKGVSKK
ncbi:MAG: HAD hydrolase family protein [Elusimicrobiaceae bacterium]|nr:HAD hydrolase family protein [Elusimicrobiaceae bacterium]